ncbi:lantibiotic dehydratase [Streptomyces violascens]|uniref:lantibiotic dehydratase n=1 Tax=Streptomyces violascens TaxID=67381 RepID=UPI003674881E
MASSPVVRYRWRGGAMLRATTRPGPVALPETLDLDDPIVTRSWLARVWRCEGDREVLRIASPVLCQMVDSIVRGTQKQPRQIRRAALSVASYLLRWQHRPTPFGYFAGTAPVSVGPAPRGQWGDKHRVVVRADAEWVTDIVQQLQRHPELLERLPVVANNTAQARGDRLVAPGPPADGLARLMAPVEVSIPNRRPVQAAMHAARTPIRYRDLRNELVALFPAGTSAKIDALLVDLIEQNLLVTSLRAPGTILDALGHVCAELERVDAHALPGVGDLVRAVYAVRDELTIEPSWPTGSLGAITDRMVKQSSVTPAPLLIDTALACDVTIPEQVVAEVEAAMTALYRVSPLPYGYQQWRDYHRRFRARYGVGAVVPVLDLVADSGLGWPAEYVGSERGKAAKQVTDRDDAVLALVQRALVEGRGELVLTDAVVADLVSAAGSEEPLFVPRAEVAFEIRASSSADLARGAFQLMLTGVPRPGSSMLGRFAHLLPPEQQDALAHTYRSSQADVITAQLSFDPRRRRNENVSRTARLLPHLISLGEHRDPEGVIGLADIAVTADARRFHLFQLSTGRPMEVRVLHALEAGIQTPPLARFLTEIANARCAVYKPFDFGTARRLPYLPRVRYRRTILTPARWLLMAEDLPGQAASTATWEEAFTTWRARLHVPDRIAMVEFDQRLALDLTHPVHRRLLRSRLDDARRLELREVAAPDQYGWIGRAHEILLPLTRTQPEEPSTLPTPQRITPVSAANIQLPGAGPVLCAHLHAHPARYSEILDRHLPELLSSFGTVPRWWFLRHREMARPEAGQHLALYLHLNDGTYGAAAEHVHAWAQGLHRSRLASHLTLETYEPQTCRFGHGPALDAAHRLFAADSAAALAQIRLAATGVVTPQALTAASLVDLTAALAGTAEHGMKWLLENVPQSRGRLEKNLRDQILDLTALEEPSPLAALPGGADTAVAWQTRTTAVHAYREALAGQRHPLTVVRSLLHQHHIRALDVDPRIEALVLRLARAAALRRFPIKAVQA